MARDCEEQVSDIKRKIREIKKKICIELKTNKSDQTSTISIPENGRKSTPKNNMINSRKVLIRKHRIRNMTKSFDINITDTKRNEMKKWEKISPYNMFCHCCAEKNYNYGKLLYGKMEDTKLINMNWTKQIEYDEYH